MDSLDDNDVGYDIDAELEALLNKEAADQGLDPESPYGGELEMIKQFQQSPSPETFEPLYNAHRKLISSAASKYSGGLPKAAHQGFALQRYVHALNSFDPSKGRQFNGHLYQEMQRLGRYKAKYSNVARVASEERGGLITTMQQVEPELRDRFGREPTNEELADEMKLSLQDVAGMQHKIHKITPKAVNTLRKELRPDYMMEQPGPGDEATMDNDGRFRRVVTFLHGSLSPEQQLIVEHTVEGFGKPLILDDMELARTLNMSPQKVRALKGQIRKQADRADRGG